MNSACACIDIDISDCHSDFHRQETRTARKAHKCCSCGGTILPNKKYEHVTGKWDGRIDTFKTCSDCLSLRDAFMCGGWFYGPDLITSILEHIQEAEGAISSDCIASLTPGAREMVCEAVEAAWEESS